MIRINLLDWRAAERERRKREFFTALIGAALVGAGIVFLSSRFVGSAIRHQDARNQYLQQQIQIADKQIKDIKHIKKVRSQLLARIKIIQNLQQSRSRIVHFFDSTVSTLPDGIYLTALKQKGDSTTLDGVARSNGAVSNYLKNLAQSAWFSDPNLIVITTNDKNNKANAPRHSTFTIQARNTSPSKTLKKGNGKGVDS